MKKLSPKNKKTIVSISIVLCLAVICVGVIYAVMPSRQTQLPEQLTPGETANFIASPEFAAMPMDKRLAYMENLRKSGNNVNPRQMFSNLPKDDRQKVRENMRPVMHEMMKQRVDKYFSLKTKEERDKFLDEEAERMKKMREERNANRDQNSGADQNSGQNQNPQRQRPSKEEIKKRIENSSPEERAKTTQYMRDMRARMHR